MQYRRLTQAELNELETQFVTYLAANSITAPDWELLKSESPDKAETLIELFSDMVFDQTLETIEYLEYKEAQDIKTFHCGPEKIQMLGLFIEGHTDVDLRESMNPVEMMQRVKAANAKVTLYSMEKALPPENRKAELFRMLENGCRISRDGMLYKTLKGLR